MPAPIDNVEIIDEPQPEPVLERDEDGNVIMQPMKDVPA